MAGLLGAQIGATGERFGQDTKTVTNAKGAKVTISEIDLKAREQFQRVVGIATKTNLEHGRLSEIIGGMSQMISGRGLGQGINQEAFAAAMLQADKAGMRGEAGVRAVSGAEGLIRGPQGALGGAIAARAVGFGERNGPGWFTAQHMAQQGFFGEGVTDSQERMQKIVGGYKQAFGVKGKLSEQVADPEEENRRWMALNQVGKERGKTAEEMEKIFSVMEQSVVTQEDLKKLQTLGQSNEEKQLGEIQGLAKAAVGTERNIEQIFTELSEVLEKPILAMERWTKELLGIVKDMKREGVLSTLRKMGAEPYEGAASTPESAEDATAMMQQQLVQRLGVGAKGKKLFKQATDRAKTELQDAMSETQTPETKEFVQRQELLRQYMAKKGDVPEAGEAGIAQLKAVLGDKAIGLKGGVAEQERTAIIGRIVHAVQDFQEANNIHKDNAREQQRHLRNTSLVGGQVSGGQHGSRGTPTNHPDDVLQHANVAGSAAVGAH
jgi:hypothetical protein